MKLPVGCTARKLGLVASTASCGGVNVPLAVSSRDTYTPLLVYFPVVYVPKYTSKPPSPVAGADVWPDTVRESATTASTETENSRVKLNSLIVNFSCRLPADRNFTYLSSAAAPSAAVPARCGDATERLSRGGDSNGDCGEVSRRRAANSVNPAAGASAQGTHQAGRDPG